MAGKAFFKYTLSNQQLEVLNGALLGDGCIPKVKIGNNYFAYLSKSQEHVQSVSNYFLDIATDRYKNGYVNDGYFDKRTHKKYFRSSFRTRNHYEFTILRNKWYNECNIKIIPNDLILTPLTCLMWYIGDGCICQDIKTNTTEMLKLATYCFSFEEINSILLPQLEIFETKIKFNEKNKPYLYIPRRKIDDFLKYIGDCPFEDYKYKWDVKPYKNKNIEKNGVQDHSGKVQFFIEDSKNGLKPFEIANKYNVDDSLVKYYLKKEKLFTTFTENNKLNNWELISPDGNIYLINNLIQFAKEHNLSHQMLRHIAHGRRDYYKGWQCKII